MPFNKPSRSRPISVSEFRKMVASNEAKKTTKRKRKPNRNEESNLQQSVGSEFRRKYPKLKKWDCI